MTSNLLAKRLKQAYEERFCSGTYSLELEGAFDDMTCYSFTYTYDDGYRVCLEITISRLGEVKFYSPVHGYYISSFSKSFKSTINVIRMLFDLIESNRETMLSYYGEEPEQEETTVEEPEQEQTTVEEPEQEETTVEEPEQEQTTVEEPEQEETIVEATRSYQRINNIFYTNKLESMYNDCLR